MRKNIKNIKSTLGIIIIISAGLLAIITYMNNQVNNNFREKGIVTKASIISIDKESEPSGVKSSDIVYSAKIQFFTNVSSVSKLDTLVNEDSLSLDEKINNLSKDIQNASMIGDYTTTKVKINKEMFDTLRKDDEIYILYMPQNPKQAKIQKYVEDFNNSTAYIFWSILFLIGIVLIFLNNKGEK